MAIGRTFQQAFAKGDALARARPVPAATSPARTRTCSTVLGRIPSADRFDVLLEVLRRGVSVERVREANRTSTRGTCAS